MALKYLPPKNTTRNNEIMCAWCLAHGKCLITGNYYYLRNSKELELGEVNQLNSVGKVFDK